MAHSAFTGDRWYIIDKSETYGHETHNIVDNIINIYIEHSVYSIVYSVYSIVYILAEYRN